MRHRVAAAATLSIAAVLGAASPVLASGQTEHFSLMDVSTNESSVVYSVIATGDFTAGGTAMMTGKVVTLQLPDGTITLQVSGKHHTVNRTTTKDACLQAKTSSGSYSISGGAGAYAGLHGSGQATNNITFVETSINGNCSSTNAAVQAVITASGPVSFG